jgi:DNA-binding MarR family transcriptional regulator
VGDAQVRQPARGGEHRVEVQHRLAHAHEDRVVHVLNAAEVEGLVEDLPRRQVAAKAHRPGRAERAGERAAGLRGEAERAPAVAVAHEHGLDRVAVRGAEESLHGAVPRAGLLLEGQRRVRNRARQLGAQRRRQVRHLVVGAGAAGRPAPRLTGPIGGLAAVGEGFLQEGEVHDGPTVAARTGDAGIGSRSVKYLTMLTMSDPVTVANGLRPTLLHLNRRLRRELAPLGITGGQASLLWTIRSSPGIGLRELAESEGVSPPAMTAYVDRLEAAGLVERRRPEHDRRRVELVLTAEGLRVLRSARGRRTAWLAARLKRLSPDELAAVEAALPALRRLIEDDA